MPHQPTTIVAAVGLAVLALGLGERKPPSDTLSLRLAPQAARADQAGQDDRQSNPFIVSRVLVADLGPERIRHAVHRRARDGPRIVGWGRRVVELPFASSASATEVVPARKGLDHSNGGCALDVNGDGVDEIVVARAAPDGRDMEFLWFEEVAGQRTWAEHSLGRLVSTRFGVPHDIVPFAARRPDGTEVKGVAAVIERQQLVWYEMPADPRQPWKRHDIGTLPAKNQSGLLVGDVAGRGRSDLLCGMFWAACPSDPTREGWTFHRFGDWDRNGWGGMTKHALADLNGDGQPEIIAAEAEIPAARLGIFQPSPDRTKPWTCRVLDDRLYCPHSLVVADLDADGRDEIVVGEMTCGGWSFPPNPRPRLLAYLNQGKETFPVKILSEGWGIHEMGWVAAGNQGGLFLYGADEIQDQRFKDMRTRVNYWHVVPRD
jgi:hypothetical protein